MLCANGFRVPAKMVLESDASAKNQQMKKQNYLNRHLQLVSNDMSSFEKFYFTLYARSPFKYISQGECLKARSSYRRIITSVFDLANDLEHV